MKCRASNIVKLSRPGKSEIRNSQSEFLPLLGQTWRCIVPAGAVTFDVNKLPGEKRSGIWIHPFDVRFLYPVRCRRVNGYYWLCIEHVFFCFRQKLIALSSVDHT